MITKIKTLWVIIPPVSIRFPLVISALVGIIYGGTYLVDYVAQILNFATDYVSEVWFYCVLIWVFALILVLAGIYYNWGYYFRPPFKLKNQVREYFKDNSLRVKVWRMDRNMLEATFPKEGYNGNVYEKVKDLTGPTPNGFFGNVKVINETKPNENFYRLIFINKSRKEGAL